MMNPTIDPQELQRLNELWAQVQPRLSQLETPADFLSPPLEPAPAAAAEPASGGYACFEQAGDELKRQLCLAVAAEQLLEMTYGCLAGKVSDRRAARLFGTLKTRQRQLARRLASVCYLLTGQRPELPDNHDCPAGGELLPTLRALFFDEAHAANRYAQMLSGCHDPCLCQLLERAQTAKREAADALISLLEDALIRLPV